MRNVGCACSLYLRPITSLLSTIRPSILDHDSTYSVPGSESASLRVCTEDRTTWQLDMVNAWRRSRLASILSRKGGRLGTKDLGGGNSTGTGTHKLLPPSPKPSHHTLEKNWRTLHQEPPAEGERRPCRSMRRGFLLLSSCWCLPSRSMPSASQLFGGGGSHYGSFDVPRKYS